jgi:hypothetical protein
MRDFLRPLRFVFWFSALVVAAFVVGVVVSLMSIEKAWSWSK